MKKYTLLSTLVSAGSLLVALTVGAQSNEFEDSASGQSPSALPAPVESDTPSSSSSAENIPTPEVPVVANPTPGQQQTLVSSTTVVGVAVKNTQGETIGNIQELMIDPETGKVTYAMITYNGQWGMGKQKSFAVPWETLKIAFNQTDVVVELEEDKLSLPTHVEMSQR